MILFFHIICLLARYIVNNISKSISKRNTHADDTSQEKSLTSLSSDYLGKQEGYAKQPIYKDGTLKFFPPMYVQRYETVALILEDAGKKEKIRKVVDFGCAELDFFVYLKNIAGINEILEVDIDAEMIGRHSFKAAPLTSDYLMSKSNKPLDVYILAGSIADYDDYLADTDVVIGIELIEHLTEEAFEKMPYNVFSLIKPTLAIFTTPNADFNELFPNFPGMRHSDHKFEWTRKEFYHWSQEIIKKYPEYSIKFYGIGAGPEGTENLGCCSQMVVFHKTDSSKVFLSAREEHISVNNYSLIKHFKYPFCVDNRSIEEKILNEIQYQISHISALPSFYSYEESETVIPLALLKEYVSDLCSDDEQLRNILTTNGMKITKRNDSWFLIYTEPELSSSENSLNDDDCHPEEVSSSHVNTCDASFHEDWDGNEEQLHLDNISNFHSARSTEDFKSEDTERSGDNLQGDVTPDCIFSHKDKTKSAPESCNQLLTQFDIPKHKTVCSKNKSDNRKINLAKSRIPRKKNAKETNYESSSVKWNEKCNLSYVCKIPNKIAKSCSLDSCLENINCKPVGLNSCHLNLTVSDSVPIRNDSMFSSKDSGSSLFSSSLDRAADSGYPISFSPLDADLTPEQVGEQFLEDDDTSRSTSASSDLERGEADLGIHQNLFFEEVLMENGDLANNNRDGEGNNVEGLIGHRAVNELAAERDPNDNMMFFPEVEEFPPWLLNLGDLALRPIFIPLDDHNEDEGVGDDSSSDLNQSLEQEDLDF